MISSLRQLNDDNGTGVTQMLIEALESDQARGKSRGVGDEYLDRLERINIDDIADSEACCPICTNRFRDDKYPLIVRLPCGNGTRHIFDLECIGPWIQMNCTCPLCRCDLLEVERSRKREIQREVEMAKEEDSEEEEDGWDVYG